MIDIIKTPIAGTVLFNNSPIEIIVESTVGANYYFRLAVMVDGVQYDLQQHSKINDVRCIIDFKNDISHVFNQEFNEPSVITVTPLINLMKEVQLIVKEYEKGTNAQVDVLELPPFFIVNANNNSELVLTEITALSIYDSKIVVPPNGLITFPFFANENTTVKLFVNDNLVFEQLKETTGGVYSFDVLLAPYGLTSTDKVDIKIHNYNYSKLIERSVEIINLNVYDVTPIAFENNFNAWEYFYCFGEKETKPTYKRHVLKQTESENYPFKVSRTDKYKINTGWFDKGYYKAIGKLIECLKFVYFENNLPVKAELLTKSPVKHLTKTHYLSQDLELKRNEQIKAKDGVQYVSPPSLVNIYASADEDIPIEILKSEFENAFNGANPHTLRFPILNDVGTINIVISGTSTLLNNTTAYSFNDFEKIILTGDGFGDPYTTAKFNMENTAGISNTATIIFKRRMYDPLNTAPVISLPSEVLVLIDAPSKSITATITEPDNDPYTVIWQQIGGGVITMQETDTNSLSLSNWVGAGTYTFKITATDDHGNSSTATTTLIVMNQTINLGSTDNNLIIHKGVPTETVTLEIIEDNDAYTLVSNIQATIKLNGTDIFNLLRIGTTDDPIGTVVINSSLTFTFPTDGVLSLPITIGGPLHTTPVYVSIGFKITALSGTQSKGYNSTIHMKFKL